MSKLCDLSHNLISGAFEANRRERPVCRSEAPINRPPAMIQTKCVKSTHAAAHRPFPTLIHIKHHMVSSR